MQLIRWRRKFNFRAFANTVIKEIWGEIRPSHFSAYILLLNEASSCHMRTDESWAVTRSYTLKCGSCKRNLHATVQTLQWYSCWWSRNLAFFRLNSVNRRAHVFLLERYLKKKKKNSAGWKNLQLSRICRHDERARNAARSSPCADVERLTQYDVTTANRGIAWNRVLCVQFVHHGRK